jgi:hypothetical protein
MNSQKKSQSKPLHPFLAQSFVVSFVPSWFNPFPQALNISVKFSASRANQGSPRRVVIFVQRGKSSAISPD